MPAAGYCRPVPGRCSYVNQKNDASEPSRCVTGVDITNCYRKYFAVITLFRQTIYHIRLRCYFVVELKVKPFEPEFAGKLNFYVSAVDELLKMQEDNPTIGLLICKEMNRTEV